MRMSRLRCALDVADSVWRDMEADAIYARNVKPHAQMSQSPPSHARARSVVLSAFSVSFCSDWLVMSKFIFR